jgi:ABC-type transport system involved in multi-copper enzyme maturation permease subunit
MPENGREIFCALLRKEWQEQRWRFFLGTVVLSGLLAGLLRAQIVPSLEAAVLIFGAVGLVLVIFLAAGPVAAERADRTWEFLVAQPVTRSEVLLAKWAVGVLQLVGTMAIATVAGLLAMWSRGFRIMPRVPAWYAANSIEASAVWFAAHPALALCVFAIVGTIAMVCWFTPLYLLLARARNEFAAALGGLLLTIATLLWLGQLSHGSSAIDIVALLNPLSPLVLIVVPDYFLLFLVALPVHVAIWIILPLWYVRRSSNRLTEKWMGA